MINSFWGLDKAQSLPPNYVLTGPLTKSPENLVQSLKEKDLDLYQWLEEAQANDEAVVYISLGSVARWRDWSVKAMYFGLKKLNCKVVWSLRGDFEIPEKNDKFWVSKWVP